jgi:hypothetical protein
VCEIKTSGMRRPWPALGSTAIGNKKVEKSALKNTEEYGNGLFQGASTITGKSQQNSSSHGVVHDICIVYSIGRTMEPMYSNMHTEAFTNNFEGALQ